MPFKEGPRRAEKDENGETIYRCLWIGCTKTFGTAGHVRRHEKTHIGITPYACPHCDKSFGRSDVRAKHVATMHADQDGDLENSHTPLADASHLGGIYSSTPSSKSRRKSLTSNTSPSSSTKSTATSAARLTFTEIPHHPHSHTADGRRPSTASSTDTSAPVASGSASAYAPFHVVAQSTSPLFWAAHPCHSKLGLLPPDDASGLGRTTPMGLDLDPGSSGASATGGSSVAAASASGGHAAGSAADGVDGDRGRRVSTSSASSSFPLRPTSAGSALAMHAQGLPTTPFSASSNASSGFVDPARLSGGDLGVRQLGLGGDHHSLLPTPPEPHPLLPTPPSDDILNFDPGWEWFGHVFGWTSDENIDLDIGLQSSMFNENAVGPASSTDTLSAAWLMCATPRAGSPVDGHPGKSGGLGGMPDPFGRKDDTPWPNVFKPQVPDRPLTLAGVKTSPLPRPSHPGPRAITETSRNAMLSLIYLSHQPHWLMPDVDDFPSHETLSDFVDLYFERFHPLFPIIHKPSFWGNETPAVLLLAVSAIGATFADHRFGPLAVALCELVRRMVSWMRGSDQRAKFDRHALLAFTIQTALGVACGSREMFYHAEIFRCSIVTTCRRLHLLRGLDTAIDELYKREADPSVEERYRAYLEDEGRRRLGWGVYLLDAQMAALLNIPAIFAVNEAGIHPPTDEILWEAPDAHAWAAAIENGEAADPRAARPKFLKLLNVCLAGGDAGVGMTDFTCSIVAHTVWRMLMDQHLLQRALGVGLSDNGMDLADYPIEAHTLNTKPGHLLLRLATSTFPPSLSPSSSLSSPTPSPISHLRLTPAAMYHHAHLQFTRPGLMQRIKHVSGKYEPDMTIRGSMLWLETWMRDGREVRGVLWHAGVLNALLTEFPRGSFAELFWTFDCALVFWVILKYAPGQLASSTFQSAFFAANWFDTSPPEMWLSHGGQLILPYLGSSLIWTVSSMLETFMRRLETMPWGLAVQYRLVLGRLLQGERENVVGAGEGGSGELAVGV
ncbi:hypothetical protein IAT38_002796 [Cryptococcus sp. DSM 104549]